MADKHKTYRKIARKLYRFLIVLCTLVLIAAVIYAYFEGEV
ncbi:MAG: hypothetical protein P8Z38_02635 [Robiginitalea sp.]|jgi:hypothetical protein